MATISTHNGSTVHTAHNLRKESVVSKEPHIDPNGKHITVLHVPIREAYNKYFKEAQDEYNAKQTRADRQIKNYYESVLKDSKKHVAYEMIVGVYPNEHEQINEKLQRQIMKEYLDGWRHRNPNLKLVGVYYHADELGEPHMHIDYVPVAHNYKKGMKVQNGLNKALEEQGIYSKKGRTPQMQFQDQENEALELICRTHGIEVEHPKRGKQVEHLDTITYKSDQLEAKFQQLLEEIKKLEKEREKMLNITDQMFLQNYRNQVEHYKNKCKELENLCKEHGIQLNNQKQHEYDYTRHM